MCAEFQIDRHVVDKIRNAGFIPDILFLQIQSDNIDGVSTVTMFQDLVKEFRSKGCKVINWNGDIRGQFPHWMVQLESTINAFTNMKDVKAVANGKFLQIGIDPKTFRKWDVEQTNDVVFMGNNYGSMFPLGTLRAEACRIIRRMGGRVYGNYPESTGNLNADPADPFPKQSAESKIYSGCAIAVSISHFDVERYTSDRLFRCMGSHAFTLAGS